MSDEREPPTPELNIDEKFAERMQYQTRIAALERDLAAAQAERDALKQSINRFHHIMHKAGLHPGRTDDDLLEILERHLAKAAALRALLIRYRNEVPLGHQPHMIAHLVDAAIDQAQKELGNG